MQRYYNYRDPSDPTLLFQFRWNSTQVFYLDQNLNKWTHMSDISPKEPFLYFSSVVYLPKSVGIFILGGLDQDDNYSKKCLWFKKYKQFHEKCPMLSKRSFFSSLYC